MATQSVSNLYPQLDTPSLIVDVDIMERNIARMSDAAAQRGIKLRPHIKTHKSPWIAHRQIAAGARGITVAKLGEAQVMADAGITDILLAYPPVGEHKLRRLEALARSVDIKVSLDSIEVAEGLRGVAKRLGRRLPVYLEVDTGLGRLGLASGTPSVELGRQVAAMPELEVRAVMTHGGHVGAAPTPQEMERQSRAQAQALVDTAEELRRAGIPVEVVSPGSTLAAPFELDTPGVTEIRPGTYVFNDANTVARTHAEEADCAARIIVTVVSRPSADRAVVDGGSKTFTSDRNSDPNRKGHGIVVGYPGLSLARLSEEHGVLDIADPSLPLRVGDRLEIIPNHICPAVNLCDTIYLVRGGQVEREIPVAARGKRT